MRIHIQCIPCLFNRAFQEIERVTDDPDVRFKAMSAFLKLMCSELTPDASPAILGSKRDRLIREITGNPDPYKELKHKSNMQALKLFPLADQFVKKYESRKEKFKAACIVSVIGNLIEFDMIDYNFKIKNFEDFTNLLVNVKFGIDDRDKIFEFLNKCEKVIFLADNAGEILFDALIIEQIREMGAKVILAVKGMPTLNDATMEDALEVGMEKFVDEIITTGSDMQGLVLSEVSEEFLRKFQVSDFLIAKGMANYKTIIRQKIDIPKAFFLMAKCRPIALHFGVKPGSAIAKLVQ